MASPSYRPSAVSPPYPPHTTLNIAKSRPGHSVNTGVASKRRKQSSFSTTSSSHPLRQTSFPPEESAAARDARSPSVDSDFTAVTGAQSAVTSTRGGRRVTGKRKRGEGSTTGTAKATADGRSATGGLDEEGEEEPEGEADEGMVEEGGRVDRAAEKKKMAVLIDAFNDDQTERYNMYRRVKLKKETVRRITNQTLSQSVPPSVITTMNGFTKVFIGTLIERAREVQKQYAAAERSLPSPSHPNESALAEANSFETGSTLGRKPEYMGPLGPDHLREALRRYKRDGEGGGAGVEGTSLGLGLTGAGAARLRGKRLFR